MTLERAPVYESCNYDVGPCRETTRFEAQLRKDWVHLIKSRLDHPVADSSAGLVPDEASFWSSLLTSGGRFLATRLTGAAKRWPRNRSAHETRASRLGRRLSSQFIGPFAQVGHDFERLVLQEHDTVTVTHRLFHAVSQPTQKVDFAF